MHDTNVCVLCSWSEFDIINVRTCIFDYSFNLILNYRNGRSEIKYVYQLTMTEDACKHADRVQALV